MNFSRESRLTKKADFKNVFSNPSKLIKKNWLLLFKKNSLENPRIGIIIKKRYVKQAVNRNSIKRIVRESFRQNITKLPQCDVIVMLRTGTSISNQALRRDIDSLWENLVLKQHSFQSN